MATLVERLGTFVYGLQFEALPGEVLVKAKASLIHNISCALAGRGGADPAVAVAKAVSLNSPWGARILLGGARVSAPDAAFANGTLMHVRAQDDFHGGVNAHLGAVVIPAALAVAEAENASGADLVTAIVAGYEVMAAAGDPFSARSTPQGFRSTCIYGPMGAAAAAGKLLRLNEQQMASSLSLAANFAGGLTQGWNDGTVDFRVQAGEASRAGVTAALLAREGLRAAPGILEGRNGFYRAYTGSLDGIDGIAADLGRRWRILEVSFKFFPISGIMQNPTHAVLDLVKAHGVIPGEVEHVELAMNAFELNYPGTAHDGPCHDVGAALMSARYCVAVALRHGEVALRHLSSERDNPDQLSMMTRIRVIPAQDLPHLSCRVTIRLKDGRILRAERVGGKALSWGVTEAKALARRLAPEANMSQADVDTLIEAVLAVDQGPAVRVVDATVRPVTAPDLPAR